MIHDRSRIELREIEDIKIKSLEFYKDWAGLDRGFIMEFQLR